MREAFVSHYICFVFCSAVLSPIYSWTAVFGVSSSSCWLIAPKMRFLLEARELISGFNLHTGCSLLLCGYAA